MSQEPDEEGLGTEPHWDQIGTKTPAIATAALAAVFYILVRADPGSHSHGGQRSHNSDCHRPGASRGRMQSPPSMTPRPPPSDSSTRLPPGQSGSTSRDTPAPPTGQPAQRQSDAPPGVDTPAGSGESSHSP